jgi:DNA invertase Pin-like site-specific DNA recombinase
MSRAQLIYMDTSEMGDTAPALPVAVGYIRRSHESDARTVSLAAQRAAIEAYTRAQGWTLEGIVSDDGKSGGRRERLAILAERVKATGASRVVVFHLDRLARDIVATLDSIRAFAKKGIELHVPGRGVIEVQSATGFLTTSMEGMIAEHYRRLCAERTRSALGHLRSVGKRWTKTPRFGERWTQAGGVEPDPVEQAVIIKVQTLRAAGKSLRAISVELAAAGMLARSGRALSAETLASILRAATP